MAAVVLAFVVQSVLYILWQAALRMSKASVAQTRSVHMYATIATQQVSDHLLI
jgi:hypothetical protein